jgi:hypothetical protein
MARPTYPRSSGDHLEPLPQSEEPWELCGDLEEAKLDPMDRDHAGEWLGTRRCVTGYDRAEAHLAGCIDWKSLGRGWEAIREEVGEQVCQ